MLRRWAPVLLIVPVLAGCIGISGGPQPPADVQTGDILQLTEDGGAEIEVPVDVVLIGYDDGTAARLDERLDEEPVRHASLDFFRTFPPDPDDPKMPLSSTSDKLPMQPVATYRVHDGNALADDLHAFLDGPARINATIHDANAVETWLAERLPDVGVPVDADTPTMVLLHDDDLGEHAYRYGYTNGWLEPVRVFGEDAPILAMDLSAEADPWVLSRQEAKAYDRPVPAGGQETLDALAQAVTDATHFRLLQGAIYPITTKPCHAITLILAVRRTAATEALPGYATAREMLDARRLESGFENVTGRENVYVDVQILDLPQDDPVLDAVSRGSLATLDQFRWWLDRNWADYWVEHEGCEPYVSFLVYGDAVDPLSFGIAMYDTEDSHRISFSAADERSRFRDMYSGPAEEQINTRDESRDAYNWVNLLFAHETGHLIGQRHPQDITTVQGGRLTWSFNSVHSTMSYQTGDRTIDFGAIDHANYARNRAGFLLQAARDDGKQGTDAFQQALDHMRAYEWDEAVQALEPLVQE